MSDAPDDDDVDDLFDEYLAVVARVDAAVADATVRAGDALVCARGCHSCCAPGLSVLPVEAERIARHHETHAVVAGPRGDRCVFLDGDGACQIYEARPLLCRTHGLALRTRQAPERGLKIIDDVSVCALNYTTRSPTPAETLDADRILALLVTVDRRFRMRVELPDDGRRVPLDALLEATDEPDLESAT
jgi:Fe-S-cluster containining protein